MIVTAVSNLKSHVADQSYVSSADCLDEILDMKPRLREWAAEDEVASTIENDRRFFEDLAIGKQQCWLKILVRSRLCTYFHRGERMVDMDGLGAEQDELVDAVASAE